MIVGDPTLGINPRTRAPPNLDPLFLAFCEHFDGKLLWKSRSKAWTTDILRFFADQAHGLGFRHRDGYMLLDQVWWSEYSDIGLALEHELWERRVPGLFIHPRNPNLPQESRRLLDIKAPRKILIVYLTESDEGSLISNFVTWLRTHRFKISHPYSEQYMLIIGRPARKLGNPAILFRRYLFYDDGSQIVEPQTVILRQARSSSR